MALYDDVIELAKMYLGPAARKFVDRQIKGHLEIDGSQLAPDDLEELAKWCYTSSKLLMNDVKAREFSEKIKALRNGANT